MENKLLLFTFDYELFLGKNSGSVESCLLNPTRRVNSILKEFGLRSIYFTDTTYLLRLEQEAQKHERAKQDLELIKAQLKELAAEGNSIQPHLHPHWADAVYRPESNTWELTRLEKYRFENITERERTEIFDRSVELINKMTAGTENKVECYRAGGWSIQPFENFIPHFVKNGIRYDMSVIPGEFIRTNAPAYDFRNAPTKFSYRFGADVCLEEPEGTFTEVCITRLPSRRNTVFSSIAQKVLWRIPAGKSMGNGNGIGFEISEKKDTGMEMASVELMDIVSKNEYLKFFETGSCMQLISHPKMISAHNLNVLKEILTILSKRYRLHSDWKNCDCS